MHRARAFTLVQLLVVISSIALLVALTLCPSSTRFPTTGNQSTSPNISEGGLMTYYYLGGLGGPFARVVHTCQSTLIKKLVF
jgi:hypothetical protein